MKEKTVKILAISPGINDGTSWYRCTGPFSRLMDDYENVQVQLHGANNVEWNDLYPFDILFLQRPALAFHVKIMNMAIFMGKKVWIDFDDLLWDIPPTNDYHEMYNQPDILSAMMSIIKFATPDNCCISVSTNALAKEIFLINPNAKVYIIPNALDENIMFPKKTDFPRDKERTWSLAWRGSETHHHDLLAVKEELVILSDNVNSVEYIGLKPFWLDSSQYQHTNTRGLLEFFSYLKNRKWDAFFVCLEDNRFNRCKSNIAWLEAFFAGAITFAPAGWEEWSYPGIIPYETHHMAGDILDYMNSYTEDQRFEQWNYAWEYIWNNLTLLRTNKIRYELIQNLLKN